MDFSEIYYDADGNSNDILEMIERDPEWAINRIQACQKSMEENQELRAQLARCVEHYDDRINILREALESISNYWNGGNGSAAVDACEHARCISDDALETDDNYDEEYLMEGSIEKIKATVEVLRCAEKLYQEYFYGNDDEKAMRHNRVLVRSIHNAVRAAKEARG